MIALITFETVKKERDIVKNVERNDIIK